MLSIVRVGILETIASITCWEGPGVVRRMMMRKEIRERGKKERTNKRRTDIRRRELSRGNGRVKVAYSSPSSFSSRGILRSVVVLMRRLLFSGGEKGSSE